MKKLHVILLLIGGSWGWAAPAWSDQCAYISKSQALAALNYISIGKNIYHYCELCGDRQPQTILVKKIAATTTSDGKFWQLAVNGQEIDLAYTYVNYDPQYRVNLAVITKCPAQGFTPVLNSKNK